MSTYQALYRKYRPQTFDDVVGQMAVTQTLKTQLMSGRMSHAYLFTGSRGTGKTSCAKILAKAVNCLNPQDGNPCNCCEACRAIDSGACMDVLEIDAASNNGVDNVRDLRDDAIYTPSQVKMRVYIIDEVHMLSISAFNALLKIIEEPPEHLLFILATTELHKVPATILSRCQRFSFRRISQEDIAARLQYVAYQENIDLDDGAARVLARLADGGMRDGLSLLDQCASATTGELTAEAVYGCLGIAGEQKCGELMGYIAAHNTRSALELFNRLYTEGKDLGAMLDEMACLTRDLLVMKTAGNAGITMLSGVAADHEVAALAERFSSAELVRMMTQLQQTMSGFTRSSSRRIDAELCMMNAETAAVLNETKASGGRVICVGTTSCRTLESLVKDDGTFEASSKWTEIFIYPGYKFKCLDALITNFHLPKSTLIMLVSALAGKENVLAAYKEAVKEKYRCGSALKLRLAISRVDSSCTRYYGSIAKILRQHLCQFVVVATHILGLQRGDSTST
mgnify:CR=1 FL=1